jgi:hypothetical protein
LLIILEMVLEGSQNELAQSEKYIKMRTEELRVSELALLDSNQKLATITEDTAIVIKDLATLKESSELELKAKDAQIGVADDLLFEANEKLVAASRKLREINKELVLAYAQVKINERLQRTIINRARCAPT